MSEKKLYSEDNTVPDQGGSSQEHSVTTGQAKAKDSTKKKTKAPQAKAHQATDHSKKVFEEYQKETARLSDFGMAVNDRVKALKLMEEVVDPNFSPFEFDDPRESTTDRYKDSVKRSDAERPEEPDLHSMDPSKNQILINMAMSGLATLGGAGGQKYGMQAGVEVGAAGTDQITKNMQFREKQNQVLSQTFAKSMEAWRKDRADSFKLYMEEMGKNDRDILKYTMDRWKKEEDLKMDAQKKKLDTLLNLGRISQQQFDTMKDGLKNQDAVSTENAKLRNDIEKVNVALTERSLVREEKRLASQQPALIPTNFSSFAKDFNISAQQQIVNNDTDLNKNYDKKTLRNATNRPQLFSQAQRDVTTKWGATKISKDNAGQLKDQIERLLDFSKALKAGNVAPTGNMNLATIEKMQVERGAFTTENGGFSELGGDITYYTGSGAVQFTEVVTPTDNAQKDLMVRDILATASFLQGKLNNYNGQVIRNEAEAKEDERKLSQFKTKSNITQEERIEMSEISQKHMKEINAIRDTQEKESAEQKHKDAKDLVEFKREQSFQKRLNELDLEEYEFLMKEHVKLALWEYKENKTQKNKEKMKEAEQSLALWEGQLKHTRQKELKGVSKKKKPYNQEDVEKKIRTLIKFANQNNTARDPATQKNTLERINFWAKALGKRYRVDEDTALIFIDED